MAINLRTARGDELLRAQELVALSITEAWRARALPTLCDAHVLHSRFMRGRT